MHRLSLASGVVPEFGPAETVAAAITGGFEAVGLWIEPPLWTPAFQREMQQRVADSGLEVLDVEVVWFKPGAPDPDHFRCLDIGAALGAKNVLVVSSDPDMGANAAKLRALCEHAAPLGLRISLEFGLFTEVKTLQQALAIIEAAAHPAAALLIDPLHLDRSGGTPAEVARVARHLLPYAQFCDAGAVRPPVDDAAAIITEAIDGRLHAGDGVLPLGDLLAAMPAGIPLSLELRSKALRDGYPDAGERARATARAMRRWLAGLEAAA